MHKVIIVSWPSFVIPHKPQSQRHRRRNHQLELGKAMKRLYANQSLLLRLSLLLPLLPLLYSLFSVILSPKETAMATTTEILGVKIHKNPPQSKLTGLGVATWPKYAVFTLLPFRFWCAFLDSRFYKAILIFPLRYFTFCFQIGFLGDGFLERLML